MNILPYFYFHISVIKNTVPKHKYRDVPDCVPRSHCEAAYELHEALVSRGRKEHFNWIQRAVNHWGNASHNFTSILVYHQLRVLLVGSQSMP